MCSLHFLQLPLRSVDALWLRFQQLAVERSCAEILDEKAEADLQQQLEAAGLAPHRPPTTVAEDDGARITSVAKWEHDDSTLLRVSADADTVPSIAAALRRRLPLASVGIVLEDSAEGTRWHRA